MKKLLTISFTFFTFICFAQKKDTTIVLSAFEKGKVIAFQNLQANLKQIQTEADKQTKEYYQFLSDFLRANSIDPIRVSLHPDSLKLIDNKFQFILKPKKIVK